MEDKKEERMRREERMERLKKEKKRRGRRLQTRCANDGARQAPANKDSLIE